MAPAVMYACVFRTSAVLCSGGCALLAVSSLLAIITVFLPSGNCERKICTLAGYMQMAAGGNYKGSYAYDVQQIASIEYIFLPVHKNLCAFLMQEKWASVRILASLTKGQIVMARQLDQCISKTAALVGCSRSAVVSIYQGRNSGEPATGSWAAKAH
ncbi:hypothetical protein QTP70_020279 [Hemibagrus guttatus]|uniref:Uncharacterized protein n=1 Tax=Hemibagrus guttatus TaxID=175788 RepID=A0AAE0PXK7_9TELE|nr:hypothetical protein QTP70_020279 [Hemibagrus guttatus]